MITKNKRTSEARTTELRSTPGGVRVKRAYEPAEPADGYRVLVDRLWPRGIKKDELAEDAWVKELAPSDQLRRWFGHDPARWDEFVGRYKAELASSEAQRRLHELADRAAEGTVTLLFAARDEEHSNAIVLRDEINAALARLSRAAQASPRGAGRRHPRPRPGAARRRGPSSTSHRKPQVPVA
jgi:uncharacterized protein YeaO (DUF488 family)